MIKKLLLLLILCTGFQFTAVGQTSNNCLNQNTVPVPLLTVTSNCSAPVAMDTNNDTDYWNSAAGCGASDLDDVWANFVATGYSTTITYTPTAPGFDPILTLFPGTGNNCSATTMVPLFCSNSGGAGVAESITFNSTPATRYRIRVQDATSNTNYTGTICVVNNNNDNCAGATPLGVSSSTTCTTSFSTTSVGATQTIPAITCAGFTGNADDDVWFSFVATTTAHTVTVTPGSISDIVVDVRTGACNGTNIGCADGTVTTAEVVNLTGLTVGNTYYVRVYSYGGSGNQGTFDICVTTPTPPADPCLSVIPYGSCGTTVTPTIPSGTGSWSQTSCWFAGTPGREVIYSFTPATTGNYNIQQNSSYGYIDYFYKPLGTCSSTGWTCIDDLFGAATGGPFTLTGGVTYLFMLDPEGTAGGNVSFSIQCPLPIPANDDCSGAIGLTVDAFCNYTTYTNAGATASTGVTAPGCATYAGGDVWFSVVVPATGSLIIDTIEGVMTDSGMAIYSGTCGALTLIECDDDDSANGLMSSIIRTGLTPGQTIYIRMWEFGNNNNGTFGICVTTTSPPPNDLCTNATTLNCGTSVNGTTNYTTNVTPASVGVPCTPMSNYGVWYTFVGTGGQMVVTVTPASTYNPKLSVMTGTCGSFTIVPGGGCYNSGGNGVEESFSFNSVLGTTYTVYIAHPTAASTATGNFSITLSCCTTTPPNTTPSCAVVAGGLGLNGADPAPINCTSGGCVDLEADYLKLGNTNSYRVEQIPYNPPATGALLPIGLLADDYFSSTITFPGTFGSFCFYGTAYPDFVYGANGVISFDSARLAGGQSGYDTNYNIPAAINASFLGDYYFGPSIFGVHHDINPGVASPPATMQIGRRFDNTPGCERMIIAWVDVPMFSDNSLLYSGKMILYKNSNIIEIYIEKKPIDGTWNDGNGTVGLQQNATNGIAAPCRNTLDPNWTVTNPPGEAWRFVPDANVNTVTSIEWWADTGSGFVHDVSLDGLDTPNVCPTVTTTYEARVTYNPTCGSSWTITDQTVVTVGDKVWNGSVDTNWYVDANWTPTGIPTAADCVVIPNVTTSNNRSPIADASNLPIPVPPSIAYAKSVSVRNNGSLTVNANTYLEITDALDVQATGDVLLNSTASLVQLTDVVANNNTGNIRVQRTVPGGVGAQNYVYWAAPVEGFDVGNINMAPTEQRWEWNPTQSGLNGTWQTAAGNMTVGRGYIVRGLVPAATSPANTAEFVGRPSNGIISTPITRGTYTSATNYTAVGGGTTQATNIDDNWNLVGNPYPSAISASAFIAENTSGTPKIDGTIYLWQHAGLPTGTTAQDPFYGNYVYNYLGSDYVATNGVGSNPPVFFGSIAAGQAFFVQMLDGVGTAPSYTSTVTFNNTMRSGSPANNNFLRTGERHRIWLDLINSNEDASSTLVGYVPDATNDRDLLYDGYDLSATPLQFYSLIGEDDMTIQGRALPFDQEDRVPLGFIVPQNGNYKIAINSLDGIFGDPSQNVYLEDTYINTIYDLRTNPYSFTSESGTFNDRFILRYTNETLSTPEQVANFGFNIIGLKDYIKVTSTNNPINTVVVYDVLGRVLADYKDINALEFKLDLVNHSKGTLIVKATLYNGQQKIKKVIY